MTASYGYCACTEDRPEGDGHRIDILRSRVPSAPPAWIERPEVSELFKTASPDSSSKTRKGARAFHGLGPVEAQAKFAYRLHVVRIAPDPHLCRDKTDVIMPLTCQGSGTIQICAGLTSAAYLREHNCESVLRTRQIVPGTAWVVEMLQVTNRYAGEGSKSAVRRLHTVRRTKLNCVRSLRNLHLSSSFCGSRP